jgi:hypothetical protein
MVWPEVLFVTTKTKMMALRVNRTARPRSMTRARRVLEVL